MVRFQDLVYKCFNLTVRFLFLCKQGVSLHSSGSDFSRDGSSPTLRRAEKSLVPWAKEWRLKRVLHVYIADFGSTIRAHVGLWTRFCIWAIYYVKMSGFLSRQHASIIIVNLAGIIGDARRRIQKAWLYGCEEWVRRGRGLRRGYMPLPKKMNFSLEMTCFRESAWAAFVIWGQFALASLLKILGIITPAPVIYALISIIESAFISFNQLQFAVYIMPNVVGLYGEKACHKETISACLCIGLHQSMHGIGVKYIINPVNKTTQILVRND